MLTYLFCIVVQTLATLSPLQDRESVQTSLGEIVHDTVCAYRDAPLRLTRSNIGIRPI